MSQTELGCKEHKFTTAKGSFNWILENKQDYSVLAAELRLYTTWCFLCSWPFHLHSLIYLTHAPIGSSCTNHGHECSRHRPWSSRTHLWSPNCTDAPTTVIWSESLYSQSVASHSTLWPCKPEKPNQDQWNPIASSAVAERWPCLGNSRFAFARSLSPAPLHGSPNFHCEIERFRVGLDYGI